MVRRTRNGDPGSMERDPGVLWIDDDLAENTGDVYVKALEERLAGEGLGQVRVKALPNPSDAVVGLFDARIAPQLIVLDWSFRNSAVSAEQVLSALMATNPAVPVFVYTGVAHMDQVKAFPNVRQFIKKPDLELLVNALTNQLRKAPPTALVLSDLHFGSEHGFGGTLNFESLLEAFAREADDFWRGIRPNILIVCGDLTSCGGRDEFTEVRKFLCQLCILSGIPAAATFIIPGNHDVFLSEQYAYNNYFEFLQRFYADAPAVLSLYERTSEKIQQDDLAFVRGAPGVAATIVGFSSTFVSDESDVRISSFSRGTIGSILTSQMTRLTEQLRAFGPSDGPRIAVLHHPLFPVPMRQSSIRAHRSDDSRIVAGQALLLNWLAQNGVQIVLHGHSHYPAARTVINHFSGRRMQPRKPIHIIASGTAGAATYAEAFHEHHYAIAKVVNGTLEIESRVLPHDTGSWITEPDMSVVLAM